ncbi:hypothetical protein Amal_02182 [Acetobacter malorum]|uniref:Uncharacterized protein n=1 Tax=Acetobacter malorum TaxID=178901 RepID=A0A177G801_9PROT|nr:hypothetical protein [Acetobacter malorum]OAG76409.1 hypothetical protein Amal_02182 [Acetobacter malorum]
MDHLFAGDTPRDFAWKTLVRVQFAGSDITLTPVLSVLALTVCVVGAGLLGKAFGVFPLRPAVPGAAAWREGAPVVQQDDAVPPAPAAEVSMPVVWTAFGVLLGAVGQKPSDWPVVEKTGAGARYLQAVLFRTVAWCEAQGMVLILLFLGAGLLLGLFAAK